MEFLGLQPQRQRLLQRRKIAAFLFPLRLSFSQSRYAGAENQDFIFRKQEHRQVFRRQRNHHQYFEQQVFQRSGCQKHQQPLVSGSGIVGQFINLQQHQIFDKPGARDRIRPVSLFRVHPPAAPFPLQARFQRLSISRADHL